MIPFTLRSARFAAATLCAAVVVGCSTDPATRATPIAESGLRTIDIYAYGLE